MKFIYYYMQNKMVKFKFLSDGLKSVTMQTCSQKLFANILRVATAFTLLVLVSIGANYVAKARPSNPFLDSLRSCGYTIYEPSCGDMQYDTDRIGKPTWTGGCGRVLPTDSNKKQTTFFLCFENGCVKLESQFDISQRKHDTCFIEYYYGLQCDSMWTEEIDMQINSTGEMIINTSTDVIVSIYKACKYSIDPPVMKFLAVGTGSNQVFQINLENTVSYVVVFRNSEDFIVNIKKIGGI